MPSTSVELYERLRLHIEKEYTRLADEGKLPADSPWRDILVDHGEVRSWCEDTLKEDGFTFLDPPHHGWITKPEKYNNVDCMLDDDEISDALQYLIEEWDYAIL